MEYVFNENIGVSGTLFVTGPDGIHQYCDDNDIPYEEFLTPVYITMTENIDCSEMFRGCRKFLKTISSYNKEILDRKPLMLMIRDTCDYPGIFSGIPFGYIKYAVNSSRLGRPIKYLSRNGDYSHGRIRLGGLVRTNTRIKMHRSIELDRGGSGIYTICYIYRRIPRIIIKL